MRQRDATPHLPRRLRPGLLGFGLLVAAVLLAGLWPAPAAARQPRPRHALKIATLAPDGSAWMRIMREMDEAIRAATENRVGIKFYPGGVQGDELVVLRKIRLGQLHGGGFTGQGLGAIAPDLRVLEVPFLYRSYDEVDRVHAELDATFEEIMRREGYAVLGWADVGFVYLFTNAPVHAPEELRDVKMWLWEGDPLATAFFESFGVAPIPLALTDVLTSLQTGLIDGVYSSPMACVALQWYTRVQYMTDVPLVHAMGAMVVDLRAWEKIPEEDRRLVQQIADQHFRRLTEATRAGDREAIETMQKRGIEVVAVDPGELQGFVERGRTIWHEQAGKLYPGRLLEQVVAVVEEHRAGRNASGGAGADTGGADAGDRAAGGN